MSTSRRSFLQRVAAGSVLAASPSTRAHAAGAAGLADDRSRYGHLGRTADYNDGAVVPRGLTISSVETFQRGSLALVRLKASDGRTGWGQVAPYEADITVEVLHRSRQHKALL